MSGRVSPSAPPSFAICTAELRQMYRARRPTGRESGAHYAQLDRTSRATRPDISRNSAGHLAQLGRTSGATRPEGSVTAAFAVRPGPAVGVLEHAQGQARPHAGPPGEVGDGQ